LAGRNWREPADHWQDPQPQESCIDGDLCAALDGTRPERDRDSKRTGPCLGCSRRAILQGLGVTALGTWLLGAAGCQGGGATTASTTTCSGGICISLTDPANKDLTSVGGAMIIDTAQDTILVMRTSDTGVAAVSAICTHAGCLVDFDSSAQLVSCPCHGSQFGEDGRVLRGPARQPLRSYQASLANDVITVAA